jgi:manganese/iron transport system permease protein
MGVVFSGLFGLGIVLYTSIDTDVHLDHILFGDLLGVGPADMIQTGLIALLVTAIVLTKWRDLVLFIFDPQQAGAIGLPVRLLHYGLLALLSLTIVAALTAVGIVLAIALLVAPGAIAYLLSKRFAPMLAIAVAVSVACSLLGTYASFFIDSAPAPTIVLLMSATFIVTFMVTARRPAVAAA